MKSAIKSAANARDLYDWLELASKWVVPVVVGLLVLLWNTANTNSQTRVAMMNVAVAVLNGEPKPENAALRNWAISVLESPESAPRLTKEAAETLRTTPLNWPAGLISADKLSLFKGPAE